MSSSPVAELEPAQTSASTLVNDFTLTVATTNGSGSQSSNMVLMRTLFQMGIPVSGKNLFPSNISGLPTWFTIRANKHGYLARRKETDILVCMNPETAADDVRAVLPGTVCVYDAPLRLNKLRHDVVFFEVPFAKLAASVPDTEARIRKLLANMCYVGVLAQMLGLETAEVEKAIAKQFKGKAKAVNVNVLAYKVGFDYAQANLPKLERFRAARMNANAGQVIMDGNMACALGALMAGCTVLPWYPITPASSLCESFIGLAHKYRHDPQTGKATYACIQAEDELAAVGMAIGAGWAGARAMTATAGPGISLMAEFVGLAYFGEIPIVIFDVQRVGPSTGLPTRTMQGDVTFCASLSHGDTKHICLYPCDMLECYAFAQEAFDLAEKFQTPVFVLTDLDLGMNNWATPALPYPTQPISRGKVLNAAQLEQLRQQGKTFERYRDVDGDGIPYRTLPGTDHPLAAYFTRGTGHTEAAKYSEKPDDWANNLDRLALKFDTARKFVPKPVVSGDANAPIGLLAYGSTDLAMAEAIDTLKAHGVPVEYLRLRGYPFSPEVQGFVARKQRVYVIEQNRDAQMVQLLKVDLAAELVTKLRSVAHYDGLPIDAESIVDGVMKQEKH